MRSLWLQHFYHCFFPNRVRNKSQSCFGILAAKRFLPELVVRPSPGVRCAMGHGPLHVYRPIYCSHWIPGHFPQKECWRFVTDSLFTETVKRQNHRKYVEKPEALDVFGGTYLCIDVRVLMALVLCSMNEWKSTSWREGAASYDYDFSLSFRLVGPHKDLLLAHVHGKFKQERVQYAKAELTALMNGYPPWYRERIVCAHGPSMPFPIRNDADITRGGWVVAVGLADSATRTPMALYTVPNLADKQTDGSYLARTNGSHLRIAVQRVYDILKNLRRHVPNDPRLDAVIEAVQYMIKTGTVSGVDTVLPIRLFLEDRSNSSTQCNANSR